MPLLRFTKLTDKVRNHTKTQTIRKPRKRALEKYDTLHVYVMEKLGTATVLSVKRKRLKDITLEDAQKDGFESIQECQTCIMDMHKCSLEEEFDIIEFGSNWHPNGVRSIYV